MKKVLSVRFQHFNPFLLSFAWQNIIHIIHDFILTVHC